MPIKYKVHVNFILKLMVWSHKVENSVMRERCGVTDNVVIKIDK